MDFLKRDALLSRIGDVNEVPAAVSLKEFFEGNDDGGSIWCNIRNVIFPSRVFEILKQTRDRGSVSDVVTWGFYAWQDCRRSMADARRVHRATRGHADCKLGQIAEFHTSPGVGAPIIDGAINGKPVKVQISTSSVSQIPLHEARLLGLLVTEVRGSHWYDHVAGVTQGYVAHVRLKIGDVESADLELPVTGDPRTPSRFSLVLGSDFFSQVDTEYDLPHNAIRLFKPQGCTPPQLVYWGAAYSQASIGPWRRDSPDIETEASLNGKKVRATLEAADEWSMMDPLTAEADGVRWPPRDAVAGPRIINDFGPVSEDSRIGLFDSFALGDERISNVRLLVARFDRLDWYVPRLWIGADYFRAHRIYIDVRDRLMLFSYAGGKIFDADASRGK